MNKFTILICLLCVMLLLFITASSREELTRYLNQYKEIANIQQGFKLYKFSEGCPKISSYCLTDQNGLLWFRRANPQRFYAFTGTEFIDVLATNNLAKADSISTNEIQTDDKTPILRGRNHIYRWNGYKLTAYKFPVTDRITEYFPAWNNQVFCFGERGYAILSDKSWNYYYYIGFQLTKNQGERHRSLLKKSKKLILFQDDPDSDNRVIISAIEGGYKKRLGSFEHAKLRNDLSRLRVFEDKTEVAYLYETDNNIIYRYESVNNTIKQIRLPEDLEICNIVEDGYSIDVLCVNTKGSIWSACVYSLNKATEQLRLIKNMSFDAIEWVSITPSVDLVWKGNLYEFRIFQKKADIINPKDITTLHYVDLDRESIDPVPTINPVTRCVSNSTNNRNSLSVISHLADYPEVYLYDTLAYLPNAGLVQQSQISISNAKDWELMFAHPEADLLYFVGSSGLTIAPLSKYIRNKFSISSKKSRTDSRLTATSNRHKIYRFGDSSYIVSRYINGNHAYVRFSLVEEKSVTKLIELSFAQEYDTDAKRELFRKTAVFPNYKSGCIYFQLNGYWHYFDIEHRKIHKTTIADSFSLNSSYSDSLWFNSDRPGEIIKPSTKKKVITKVSYRELFKQTSTMELPPDKELSWSENELDWSDAVFSSDCKVVYFQAGKIIRSSFLHYWIKTNPSSDVSNDVVYKKIPSSGSFIMNPTFSFDLNTGKYILQPHWLRVFKNKDGKIFVLFKDKAGKSGKLTIREVINGVAVEQASDPVISWDDYTNEYLVSTTLNEELMIPMGAYIHYRENSKWHKFKLLNRDKYGHGKIWNGIKTNSAVYLGFDSEVVKILPDGSIFVYGENEGIPKGGIYLHKHQDKILINCGDTIYEFNEPKQNFKLVNAWFYAEDKAVSGEISHKFPHNISSMRFPIITPNLLHPEKCFIEYQLMGFNEKPVRIPFAKEIRFDKLKPGKYSFSYELIHSAGEKAKSTPINFVIIPPFYSTWWANSLYILIGVLVIFGLFKLRTRQLQQRNLFLEQTVELRTAELNEQQKNIRESIEYASLIQKSILPQQEQLVQAFKQHFVIWLPRDIVGGDFYWLHTLESGETFFALIDCTGHGVPGALLSMTVNALLDKLVRDIGMREPGKILTLMHQEIGISLHQNMEHTQQDGIEIALLKLDKAKQELCFSGAGLHLLHLGDKGLEHIRCNKYGLGGLKWHQELSFDEVLIPYTEQSRIYLYTDGIIDQPSAIEPKIKRLGSSAWLGYVAELATVPFEEQQENCKRFITGLLSLHEQRDDITIIGLKL